MNSVFRMVQVLCHNSNLQHKDLIARFEERKGLTWHF